MNGRSFLGVLVINLLTLFPCFSEEFILFEAESYTRAERNVAVLSNDLASRGEAVDIIPRSRVFFEVDLPEAGVWYVWVRMFAPTDSSDSCWVGSDSGAPYPSDNSNPHPALRFYASPGESAKSEAVWGVWYWDAGKDTSDPASRLTFPSAGRVSIWVKGREAGTLIDAILLTQNPDYNPEEHDPVVLAAPRPRGEEPLHIAREQVAPGTELSLYGNPVPKDNGRVAGQSTRGGSLEPTITAFIPEDYSGTGVLLVPGGGYTQIQYEVEGTQVAGELNRKGIAAFVLSYRLPPSGNRNLNQNAVEDTRKALAILHENASKWGINPNRIGIAGFSAGGHLVLNALSAELAGSTDRSSGNTGSVSMPDFIALIYPSIPSSAPVDPSMPPVFQAVSAQDTYVSAEQIATYHGRLSRAGVLAALHVFSLGAHGFGVKDTGFSIDLWFDLFVGWLEDHRLLE